MKQLNLQPTIWLLFLLVSFPQISETIYSPSLPNIAHQLVTSNNLVQWTLSLYFIGFALGVFLWGRWSDHIGRRTAMLFTLIIYVVGSICCLVAPSIAWLLGSRLLQGLGASGGSILPQTIARESFDSQKRHRYFATTGFVLALAISAGPFIGGYVNEWFGWRANFFVLILIGVFLFSLSSFKLPETLIKHSEEKIKIISVAKQLLFDKHVWGCMWFVAAVNGILFSYYAESPFIFINLLGLSPSQYGRLGLLIAVGALLGSFASKKLIHSVSHRTLLAIGNLISLLGSVMIFIFTTMGWITPKHEIISVALIIIPMMAVIFGSFGLIIPTALSTALLKYKKVLGTAGAIFSLSYYIGVAILTGIMGLIHNGTLFPMPLYFILLNLSMFVAWIVMGSTLDPMTIE